jgi:transposase-like protein
MGRKRYTAELKTKVALEAIRETRTTSELSSMYGVHPTMITRWKREALEQLPSVFSRENDGKVKEKDALIESLYQRIGQLTVELDWLKKKTFLTK